MFSSETSKTAFLSQDLPFPNTSLSTARPKNTASYKWIAFGLMSLSVVLWRNASISQAMHETSRDAKLSAMMHSISESIITNNLAMNDAKITAKYWEGVAEGISQSKSTHKQQKPEHHPDHSKKIVKQRTVGEVLESAKKDVEESTKSTIETLAHALNIDHIKVTQADKKLAAEKLVEVAVAFERAAEKLNQEAHLIVGDKEADAMEVRETVAAVENEKKNPINHFE